jgi:hypothetical protein
MTPLDDYTDADIAAAAFAARWLRCRDENTSVAIHYDSDLSRGLNLLFWLGSIDFEVLAMSDSEDPRETGVGPGIVHVTVSRRPRT